MAAALPIPLPRSESLIIGRRARWLGPLAIVAATAAAYANSFGGAFVFDDPTSIAGNPTIHHLSNWRAILATPHATVSAEGRPVLNLSLALNYAAGRTHVWGYHAVNLAIHCAAALLLCGVLRRLFARIASLERWANPLGFAVALLWAVHPLQTESVTYIIQRAESLMGLFFLLTLYAFLRGWSVVAVIACFLGMATKENMVCAPLAVLLCDRLLYAGSFKQALRSRPGMYAGLAASWVLLAYLLHSTGYNRGGSIGFGLSVNWTGYWLTQFSAVTRYLSLSIWPHPLIFEYGGFTVPGLSAVWGSVSIVAALLAVTGWALRRHPAAGWAGFCFFAILAPTSLVPGTTQLIVEHRMYLPLACVLGVLAGLGALRWPRATIAACLIASVPCVILTRMRNEDYRSAITLWDATVRERPNNVLARVMLADALKDAGRRGEALTQYEKGVELRPRYPLAQESLGEFLLGEGRLDEAAEHFRAAMQAKPDYADAHVNFGVVLGRKGDLATAIAQERRAVAIKPGYESGHFELARYLARAGQIAEARREYAACLAIDPDDGQARSALRALPADNAPSGPGAARR